MIFASHQPVLGQTLMALLFETFVLFSSLLCVSFSNSVKHLHTQHCAPSLAMGIPVGACTERGSTHHFIKPIRDAVEKMSQLHKYYTTVNMPNYYFLVRSSWYLKKCLKMIRTGNILMSVKILIFIPENGIQMTPHWD